VVGLGIPSDDEVDLGDSLLSFSRTRTGFAVDAFSDFTRLEGTIRARFAERLLGVSSAVVGLDVGTMGSCLCSSTTGSASFFLDPVRLLSLAVLEACLLPVVVVVALDALGGVGMYATGITPFATRTSRER